jgi:hypothetical protein
MGFLSLLRSIEDLLYELMTWLLFYPRTLWQVIRHPVRMAAYSDTEQKDTPEEQYTDTLSPPLFLVLSILIAHAIELSLHTRIGAPREGFAKSLLSSQENLLFLRCILFSIYPLTFASTLVMRSEHDLDRNTLRGPFFSQCYLAGLFALLLSVGTILAQLQDQRLLVAAMGVTLLGLVWYITVQAIWFRDHLALSRGRSASIAIVTFFKASFVNSLVSGLFIV